MWHSKPVTTTKRGNSVPLNLYVLNTIGQYNPNYSCGDDQYATSRHVSVINMPGWPRLLLQSLHAVPRSASRRCNCTEMVPYFQQIGVAHSIFISNGSNLGTWVRFPQNVVTRTETILNLVLKFKVNRTGFHGEVCVSNRWESRRRRRKKNRAFAVTIECLRRFTRQTQLPIIKNST